MPSPRTSRSRPSIRGRRPRRTARSPATDSSSKARSNATEPTRSCRRKAPARARSSTRRPWPRRPRAEGLVRKLIPLRLAEFLVKPVDAVELVRACGRVAKSSFADGATAAEIYTFLPAAGGVGVTTLAVETAMLLMRRTPRGGVSTCLVDLDFQHGACADYLDIEPRLDIGEIEPRPERLDGQLLEVMLSQHGSGLAVVAAPNRPAEMRSFDADVATRLLDMVSSRFDHVVIDMPRTWFAWTDSVLLGSNRLFVVTEMTVPGVRHA